MTEPQHLPIITRPRALLADYGGTLVEEVAFDARAGSEWLLTHTTVPVTTEVREQILDRSDRVAREVAVRRDELQIETPWASLTRLIYDACGVVLDGRIEDLELGFWSAAATTRPMPGARDALTELRRAGLSIGVVSNSSFGQRTLHHELAKHGFAELLDVIVVSAEYVVRKPNPMLFEAAAGLIRVPCADIWFVGDRLDTDIAGATAAGMTPIWYAPHRQQQPPASPPFAVAAWSELVAMFRETGRAGGTRG